MFGELAKFTAEYLKKGLRVAIQCRQSHHRTEIRIDLALRHLGSSDDSCLRTMARMRPEMQKEFVKKAANRVLHRMAQGIFTNNSFKLRLAFDEL